MTVKDVEFYAVKKCFNCGSRNEKDLQQTKNKNEYVCSSCYSQIIETAWVAHFKQ